MGFIIAAAVAAAVIAFCFLCYKKAPPTQAIVVTGFGLSRPKVVCGRGVFVLPIVQRADRLNMRLLKIDVKTPETGVKTKEGVSLWLDSVVTVQVYSENSTVSDEEVRNAGYDDIRKYINSRQQAAISNFLGMDEAHMIGRGKYFDLHGASNRFNLLLRHLSRVRRLPESMASNR